MKGKELKTRSLLSYTYSCMLRLHSMFLDQRPIAPPVRLSRCRAIMARSSFLGKYLPPARARGVACFCRVYTTRTLAGGKTLPLNLVGRIGFAAWASSGPNEGQKREAKGVGMMIDRCEAHTYVNGLLTQFTHAVGMRYLFGGGHSF